MEGNQKERGFKMNGELKFCQNINKHIKLLCSGLGKNQPLEALLDVLPQPEMWKIGTRVKAGKMILRKQSSSNKGILVTRNPKKGHKKQLCRILFSEAEDFPSNCSFQGTKFQGVSCPNEEQMTIREVHSFTNE